MLQRRRKRDPDIVMLASKLLGFLEHGVDVPWKLEPEDVLYLIGARIEATDMSYAAGEVFCQALLARLAMHDAAVHDMDPSASLKYLARGARFGAVVQASIAGLRRDAAGY